MSVFVSSLNSGSNGNCYYVANKQEAILVDAGLTCKETEIRMKRLGLSLQKVKAIFISHEHTDHIKGLAVLSKKYQIPVYITSKTLQNSRLNLETGLVKNFTCDQPVQIGKLTVYAFSKVHDACEPHSFLIENEGVKIGVFTDLGIICEQLIHHFRQCNAAFLEANYCENLLEAGRYPYFLKNRIRGGRGHLSNTQALQLFKEHQSSFITHLFLAHLSKQNNSETLVYNLFKECANNIEIIVASRNNETPVYEILSEGKKIIKVSAEAKQLMMQFS